MMENSHTWIPFMARIAILPEPAPADIEVDFRHVELSVRRFVEEEGGRITHFYWYEVFNQLDEDAALARLITIFETRSQYPVWRNGELSLEAYVRPPVPLGGEIPATMDPEEMALSIQAGINGSGSFFVTDIERWGHGSTSSVDKSDVSFYSYDGEIVRAEASIESGE